MDRDSAGRSARPATATALDSSRNPADGPFLDSRSYRDFDELTHSGLPPGFECTLTGPETGPFVRTWVWLVRGGAQFGTEGGPNVGHGAIPEGFAVFHVPLEGPAPISFGTKVGPTCVAVLGPGSDQIEAIRAPGRWATFAADLGVLDEAGSRLGLGRPVYDPGRVTVVEVGRDAIRRIRRSLADVERRARISPAEFSDPGVRETCLRQFADLFVASVGAGNRVLPRGGRAAGDHAHVLLGSMRFLGATKDRAVSIDEVCRVVGTSQRTLSRAFLETFEVSPARYFRLRRMNQVRAWLRRGVPAPATVTEAATRFEFFELGRFAAGYRRLFGELPSDTHRHRSASPPSSPG